MVDSARVKVRATWLFPHGVSIKIITKNISDHKEIIISRKRAQAQAIKKTKHIKGQFYKHWNLEEFIVNCGNLLTIGQQCPTFLLHGHGTDLNPAPTTALPVRPDLDGHHARLAEQHRLEGSVLEQVSLELRQVLKSGLTICPK